MTAQEKKWFKELARDREESARVFMKASNRGVWNAIVDKYSDQAHFIYELLQNADDAGATRAEFSLEEGRLLFKHNGTRRFSITSPQTEEADFERGHVGDLNAITGAGGFSTKKNANAEGNAIGKFGVGFKAVFQYTASPRIYDDSMSFRLEKYIVPVLIKDDESWRKKGETLFVFPFDKEGLRNPAEDIRRKLKSLTLPTLFLNNLQTVHVNADVGFSSYGIIEHERTSHRDIDIRRLSAYAGSEDDEKRTVNMWLFTRRDSASNKYSVGYVVDKDGVVKPVDYKAFCYFPTKHDTKLKFIVHAPFLLTDSREGIKAGEPHNAMMISRLAGLAAEALSYLCRKSSGSSQRAVSDSIVKVLPVTEYDYGDNISFDDFRQEFADLFYKESVIPTTDSYVRRPQACWAESIALPRLFTDRHLRELKAAPDIAWAFPSIPQERKWSRQMNADIFDFIDCCTREVITDADMIGLLNGAFIEKQDDQWLCDLYKWIGANEQRVEQARKIPIFLDQKRKACPAFSEGGKPVLFLPMAGEDDQYHFINEKLRENPATRKLLKMYEVSEPSKEDYIRLILTEKFPTATDKQCDNYFKVIFNHYVTLPLDKRRIMHDSMRNRIRLRCADSHSGARSYRCKDRMYLPNDGMETFFDEYIEESPIPYAEGEEVECVGGGSFVGLKGVVVKIDHVKVEVTVRLKIFSREIDYPTSPSNIRHVKEPRKKYYRGFGVSLLDLKHYRKLLKGEHEEDLSLLLDGIGVLHTPAVVTTSLGPDFRRGGGKDIEFSEGAASRSYAERFEIRHVEGASEFANRIAKGKDPEKKKSRSIQLWDILCKCANETPPPVLYKHLDGTTPCFLTGVHIYERYGKNFEGFDSPQRAVLRSTRWIVLNDGRVRSPSEVAVSELPDWYDTTSAADKLISALGMNRLSQADLAYQVRQKAREALVSEDQESIRYGEKLKDIGYTAEEAYEILRREKERQNRFKETAQTNEKAEVGGSGSEPPLPLVENIQPAEEGTKQVPSPTPAASSHRSNVAPHVLAEIEENLVAMKNGSDVSSPSARKTELQDEDEITPTSIDFERKIKDSELRQAGEIALLERGRELQDLALQFQKYSFGWIKAMLGLEILGMDDDRSSQHEISISFAAMTREPGSQRTFVLRRPTRSVPQWIEELSDVPLELLVGRKTLRPRIEAMSVKSFDLRVMLKNEDALDGIDLLNLKEARISVKRPDFLMTALQDGINRLELDDAEDLRKGLPQKIEFIFGPPGTGKTTFLAKKRIERIMDGKSGIKLLVLTPTNKAADVLTKRIVSTSGNPESYRDWLVRFGAPGDESIEEDGVLCGRHVDLSRMERCCVVTTIARFPYDRYVPGNAAPVPLEDVEWDYIVIDEASMIPLVNIVYVLYKKPTTKFIIAGDPFQIDPIVRNEAWSGENIYTMVKLNDFANPSTEPRAYPIVKLTRQYRCLPCIGELFSSYRYAGILEHNRSMKESGKLKIKGMEDVRPLSIIKFPVSKYESIYSLKRLKNGQNGGSPFQTYSALFVYEYVCALARNRMQSRSIFRIGVISPYKAQADLVQRLIESTNVPNKVEVTAGTVHGFQGDECDMIIALLNPPPGITGGNRAFINRKNIINVAISRARDYLVLVIPDDDTENIECMTEAKKIERGMLASAQNVSVIKSHALEQWMFASETFIEDNSFSSGHQNVNVYGPPDYRYVIRSEETAVDIQVHPSSRKRIPATVSSS